MIVAIPARTSNKLDKPLWKDYKRILIFCLKATMIKTELEDQSTSNKDYDLINPVSKLILIKDYEKQIAELKKAAVEKEDDRIRNLESEERKVLAELKEDISKGKSTGNKAIDFIAVSIAPNFERYDLENEKQYIEIFSSLEKHQGEKILIKHLTTENSQRITKFKLGIIKKGNPKIDSKFNRLLLTDKAITFESENLGKKPYPVKNLRKLDKLSLQWYEKPIISHDQKDKINIFIGDKEVNEKLQNYKIDNERVKYFSPILAKHLKTA